MSWDASVYLAKRRITKKTFAETYDEMQKRFGAPVDDDADERLDDSFGFARFRLRVCKDAGAGMYLFVSSDDVGAGPRDVEEAGSCMAEWAELLGGEISEEEWNARKAGAVNKVLTTRKLAKYGPADTICYVAFDAEGNERGKKSLAKEMVGLVEPRILQPAWLREHEVVRVEYVSYGSEGTVTDQISYDISRTGKMKCLLDRG